MSKAKIIYQAGQQVVGKHLRSKEYVMYSGTLTIYNRKLNPIVLKLKTEIDDSFIRDFMEDRKEFKGNSVSEIYGKLAKWYAKNGILFEN